MLLFVRAGSKQSMENWCMRRCDCNLSLIYDLSYHRPTKFGLHAYNCLETALGKLAGEVKANDARLGLKELNQVRQGFKYQMQDILIDDSALENMGFQTNNSSKQYNSIRTCYLKMCDNENFELCTN